MSISFKLCPTHFSKGGGIFAGGRRPLRPRGYWPAWDSLNLGLELVVHSSFVKNQCLNTSKSSAFASLVNEHTLGTSCGTDAKS